MRIARVYIYISNVLYIHICVCMFMQGLGFFTLTVIYILKKRLAPSISIFAPIWFIYDVLYECIIYIATTVINIYVNSSDIYVNGTDMYVNSTDIYVNITDNSVIHTEL